MSEPGWRTARPWKSAAYLSEHADAGEATLEGCEFREQAAPGSASEVVIRLGRWSLGDLDGRRGLDAAAVTVEHPGGSGTFYYVHALRNEDGDLRDAGAAFLGDRIRVEGISVHDGVITVAMLERGPNESFAVPPSIAVIRRFRLQGDALVEMER